MGIIIEKDLQKIFQELQEAGWNPELCNVAVPLIDSGVQAGVPTDNGEYTHGELFGLPESLINCNPTFVIVVKGESMKDANILPGDRVQVTMGVTARDGDIVILAINDEYTLKAYFTDERGNQWAVPYNKAYKPLLLTPDMKLNIVGKVTCVVKDAPRMPYNEMMKRVLEVRDNIAPDCKAITPERVEQVIRYMGVEVKQVRQWYAVFRAMVDLELLADCDYDPFVEKVSALLPTHKRLPVTAELRRMATDSFRKEVDKWKSNDAPVSGYRFDYYLKLAKLTKEKLLK